MTSDEPDEQLEPASAADEARIRALLSEARVTGSMPADVGARLDRVLEGLAAERGEPVPADDVVPLARTRRHRVVAVLGIAAAAAVFGLAVGAVVQGGSDGDSGGASDSAVDRGLSADDVDAQEAESPSEEPATGTAGEKFRRVEDRAYPVRARQLTRDLAAIQDATVVEPGAADYAGGLVHAPADFECELPARGRGVLVAVRYDGAPAYVRFLEPMGDSQVVEVLQCGTGDLLRSTTLPTRG